MISKELQKVRIRQGKVNVKVAKILGLSPYLQFEALKFCRGSTMPQSE